MTELNITKDEWLDELKRLRSDDAGMTTHEIAVLWGMSDRTVRDILAREVENGRYLRGWATRTTGSGVRRVPVYSIVKPEKKRGGQ